MILLKAVFVSIPYHLKYIYIKSKINLPLSVLGAFLVKKNINCLNIGLFLILLCMSLVGCSSSAYNKSQVAMDTLIDVSLNGKSSKEAGDLIFQEISDFEGYSSMYVDNSDVSEINANAGKEEVSVCDDLYILLKRAYTLCEESNGKFDITIGPLVKAWDVNAQNPVVPQITDELKDLVNYKDVLFNDSTKAVKLAGQGQILDLGGIAKGYLCDKIYEIIKSNNIDEAIINIGGNVIVYGNRTYNVGLQHPRKTDEVIATIGLTNTMISTAGDYQRYFEADGRRYHHIIDPKSGQPYESDFYSVSVIGSDGTLCDYLSTLMFMTPKDELISLLDDYKIIAIGKDNKIYASKGLDISLNDDSFSVYNS